MGLVLGVLVAVTSVLTAAPSVHDPVTDLARIEHLVFDVSLAEFTWVADHAADAWLEWRTDWCSAPLIGSTGRTFDFRAPCRRHDFAYRNLRLLDRRYSCARRGPSGTCPPGTSRAGRWWTAAQRRRVDERFRLDLHDHCRTRPWWDWTSCTGWAETYYRVVRIAGGP